MHIPEDIALHIMSYLERYYIVKMLVGLGYSTKHMDKVFKELEVIRPPIVKKMDWRGLHLTIHDDQIVDMYYEFTIYPDSDHMHTRETYVEKYKRAEEDSNITIHDSYLYDGKWVYARIIDNRVDVTINDVSIDREYSNHQLTYPRVYFQDDGCHYIMSDEIIDAHSITDPIVPTPQSPSIYTYHDILFGLALLAKRGYWMKETYMQCYKGNDYEHYFYDYGHFHNPDEVLNIKYHAVGDKIVGLEVETRYDNSIIAKMCSICNQGDFLDWHEYSYQKWCERGYRFGLELVKDIGYDLSTLYYMLLERLPILEEWGYTL